MNLFVKFLTVNEKDSAFVKIKVQDYHLPGRYYVYKNFSLFCLEDNKNQLQKLIKILKTRDIEIIVQYQAAPQFKEFTKEDKATDYLFDYYIRVIKQQQKLDQK